MAEPTATHLPTALPWSDQAPTADQYLNEIVFG